MATSEIFRDYKKLSQFELDPCISFNRLIFFKVRRAKCKKRDDILTHSKYHQAGPSATDPSATSNSTQKLDFLFWQEPLNFHLLGLEKQWSLAWVAVSIQCRFVIKSRLKWHEYITYVRSAPFADLTPLNFSDARLHCFSNPRRWKLPTRWWGSLFRQ